MSPTEGCCLSNALVLANNGVLYAPTEFGYPLAGVVRVAIYRIIDLSAPLPIGIDSRPGSDTNPIQPFSRGVIPLAILGSEDFDVDERSTRRRSRLGPAELLRRRRRQCRGSPATRSLAVLTSKT